MRSYESRKRGGSQTSIYEKSLLALSIMLATAVSAQDQHTPEGGQVPEKYYRTLEVVTVTAQKRSESIQDIPIAVSALGEDQLAQKNINDMTDLDKVTPSLKIDTPYGNTAPKITLRGVGSGSFNLNTETTVALYVDEIVMNPVSAKLGQLFDLNRVEVLRGPQGTLYGKNSTGGAINYITNRPEGSQALDINASVAKFGEHSGQVAAQTGISDTLSARVSLNRRYREGYQRNTVTDEYLEDHDEWGARIGLRYESDRIDAYLKAFADRSHTDGFFINTYGVNSDGSPTTDRTNPLTGYKAPNDIDKVAYDHEQSSEIDNYGVSLNLDVEIGDLTFSSITGALNSKSSITADQDGSPVSAVGINFTSDAEQFTQEFRLSSNSASKFTWIAGVSAFYQNLKLDNSYELPLFGLPPVRLLTDETTQSFAVFVDGTYDVSEALSIFGGLRVTTDKKEFEHQTAFSLIGPFNIDEEERWTEPSYRVGAKYHLGQDTLVYASYNRGYRSGAFDTGFPTTPEQFKPADPEFIDSYEAGLKTSLFDNRLSISSSVFFSIFQDQQLLIQRPEEGSICCSLVNAGESEIYGLEFDGTLQVSNYFDVEFQGSVIRSEYTEFNAAGFNLEGKELANVPRYQLGLAPNFYIPAFDGEFFLSPSVHWTGRQRVLESSTVNPYSLDIQKPYTVVDGQLGFRSDRYTIFAYVKNATDERYKLDVGEFSSFGYNQTTYSSPRTYGVSVQARFR